VFALRARPETRFIPCKLNARTLHASRAGAMVPRASRFDVLLLMLLLLYPVSPIASSTRTKSFAGRSAMTRADIEDCKVPSSEKLLSFTSSRSDLSSVKNASYRTVFIRRNCRCLRSTLFISFNHFLLAALGFPLAQLLRTNSGCLWDYCNRAFTKVRTFRAFARVECIGSSPPLSLLFLNALNKLIRQRRDLPRVRY